jgi:hypothetical protein
MPPKDESKQMEDLRKGCVGCLTLVGILGVFISCSALFFSGKTPEKKEANLPSSVVFSPGVEGRSQEEVCNSTSQACQRWTELARKCEENMRQREAGYTGRLHPYCGEMEAFREEVTGVPLSSSPGAYDF